MRLPTPAQFLKLLSKSRLLETARLEEVRGVFEARKGEDIKDLAKELVRAKALTLWQANQLLAGRVDFHLGKYRLIDLLGRGGLSNVFLAEHMAMGRLVALKVLAKRMERHAEVVAQFYEEAKTIASLNHRNVVHVYNVERTDDRHVMVMEYVDGLDLQRIVQRRGKGLAWRKAVEWIAQAAEGLAHAHAHGVLHCDVKPSNLVVNQRGVVKILDLGTARKDLIQPDQIGTDSMGSGTRDEIMRGTVDYMAPEQALDAPDLDHRADIYSLGCTLYFALSGRPPFDSGTLAEKILKHQAEPPVGIGLIVQDIPAGLADLCGQMMAKSPLDRPQSAEEVASRLHELVK